MDVLRNFIERFVGSTKATEVQARAQLSEPTCYPDSLEVTPGVVLQKPGSVDYAPDIEVAESKIRQLTALARSGRMAVINISVEPGSGKTLFLPYRFTEGRSLVVLPTITDAWLAHTAAAGRSDIHVYGFESQHGTNVVYTDSYHAAWLFTTGKVSAYTTVFVDESHSQEGVTSFLADVARPGIVMVRMTASPPNVNSYQKKSFPIIDEHDVPDISSLSSAADYINARQEERVVVMTPTAKTADALAKLVKGSVVMSYTSSPEELSLVVSNTTGPIRLITDNLCSKGVNLNADCVVDFGRVGTPGGDRSITRPEQLQRRARVGRNKPGVYCCSFQAVTSVIKDDYSVFRCNLWRIVNGLPTERCGFPDVDVVRAVKLLTSSVGQPALEPVPTPHGLETPVSIPVTPMVDDQISESEYGDDSNGSPRGVISIEVAVHDDDEFTTADYNEPIPPEDMEEVDYLTPDWYNFYVNSENHPVKYVMDLVYHHRGADGPTRLGRDVVIEPVINQSMENHARTRFGGRLASPPLGLGIGETTMAGGSTDMVSSKHEVVRHEAYKTRFGSKTYNTNRYEVTAAGAKAQEKAKRDPSRLCVAGRPVNKAWVDDLNYDNIHIGGPLVLMRSVKKSGYSKGCAYKAASVCAGFFTTQGLILASGSDLHKDLVPIPQKIRRDLAIKTTDPQAINATHYAIWCTTVALTETSLDSEIAAANRSGAWVVPPNVKPPPINLETNYHRQWVDVITNLIRGKSGLPTLVPRCGWRERAGGRRQNSETLMDDAFDACEQPTYTESQVRLVTKAWNVVALRSRAISRVPEAVYNDASVLLAYLSNADEYASAVA